MLETLWQVGKWLLAAVVCTGCVWFGVKFFFLAVCDAIYPQNRRTWGNLVKTMPLTKRRQR